MKVPILCCLVLYLAPPLLAQDNTSISDRILQFPDRLFNTTDKKVSDFESKLIQQTDKYLRKLAKQEQRLQKKLSSIDSIAAKEIFGDVSSKYAEISARLNSIPGNLNGVPNVYSARIDSLKTSLQFLNVNKLLGQSEAIQNRLKELTGKMQGFQGKLNQAEEIKKFIAERQMILETQMEKFGLTRQYRKFQKDVYYYKAQIEEYKTAFQDPSRIERKLLEIANHFPSFREFFRKNSELASLFRLPGNDPLPLSVFQGLQTRAMVLEDLQQRFGSGPDFQQQLNQSLTSAQSQLSQLRNKIRQQGGNQADLDMPNFRPNPEKTKNFWNRIETGMDIQSTKSTYYFPVTTDIALNAGYKINNFSVAGIAIAYKMGLGRDIRNIEFSNQGIGLRSYADLRLRGNIWISGGAELNYHSTFKNFEILKDFTPWQRSVLLGMTKKYKVGRQKGKIQLLYDILSNQQIPVGQRWVFRTGFNF